MECGKGAYVRSIARDLGRLIGCFGHVTALRRTRVGPFLEEDSFTLDEIEGGEAANALLSVEAGLTELPCVVVDRDAAARLRRGGSLILRGRDAPAGGIVYAACGGVPVAFGRWWKARWSPRACSTCRFDARLIFAGERVSIRGEAPSPSLPRFAGEGADSGLHRDIALRRSLAPPLPRRGGGMGRGHVRRRISQTAHRPMTPPVPKILVFDSGLGGLTVFTEVGEAAPARGPALLRRRRRLPLWPALREGARRARHGGDGDARRRARPRSRRHRLQHGLDAARCRICGRAGRSFPSSALCRRSSPPPSVRARVSSRCWRRPALWRAITRARSSPASRTIAR